MSSRRQLHTTDDEFDALHRAVAKTRKTSKTVVVDRQALMHLLMDHSNLVSFVGNHEATT